MTTARLENWSIHFGKYGTRLTGEVHGHPDYGEGVQLIVPVKLQELDRLKQTFTTRTAVYQLGCAKYQGVKR